MLGRPAVDGRGSSQQQKLFLAFAVILLPWLQLTNAQQQRQPVQQAAHSIISPHAAPADVAVEVDGSLDNRERTRQDASAVANAAQKGPDHWDSTPISASKRPSTIDTPSSGDRKRSVRLEQQIYQRQAGPGSGDPKRSVRQEQQIYQHQQKAESGSRKNLTPDINNPNHKLIPDDASAAATLAPDNSVRAPSPLRQQQPRSAPATGLTSPQYARSLEDWEVEDFVLLATVDGDLYANDRNTGKQLWHLEVDQPMVETIHYRGNSSALDEDYSAVDHYIWAIEPNRDGGVFVWIPEPNARPRSTGFTMKELVEVLSPFAGHDPEPAVVYVGDKRTTMVTLDAATGRVIKWFGTGGSHVNEAESCLRPNALYDTSTEECSTMGTITLGRTEYTVGIERRDGKPIATLKYAEWTPNNRDKDLFHQYHVSKDNQYISSQHDGSVYAFDYTRSESNTVPGRIFSQKFSAPVARVFDVCRSWNTKLESNPDLVLLSQPTMPIGDNRISNTIFLNRTKAGGWYALSSRAYPLINVAPLAQVSLPGSWEGTASWDTMTEAKLSKLVGSHLLGSHRKVRQFPTLPDGSASRAEEDPDNQSTSQHVPIDQVEEPTIVDKVKSIPQSAANSVYDFISNPVLIIFLVGLLVYNRKNFTRAYQLYLNGSGPKQAFSYLLPGTTPDDKVMNPDDDSSDSSAKLLAKGRGAEDSSSEGRPLGVGKMMQSRDTLSNDAARSDNEGTTDNDGTPKRNEPSPPPDTRQLNLGEGADDNIIPASPAPEGKKKKGHRGRRGGVKHRKGRPRDSSQSRDDEQANATVEEAVSNAKKLGDRPIWEPDVLTVANDMQAVSGPIVRMGNIEVNLEEQLGTGSNGTLVFAGKFDGREVAVKRMLIQFYDIASQETRLLRESDDHPNGQFKLKLFFYFCRPPLVTNKLPSYPVLLPTNPGRISFYCFGTLCCLISRDCGTATCVQRAGQCRKTGLAGCSIPDYQWYQPLA
jgi:serine/threonine-protein kinase/endoribonuclease IRE1